MRAAWYERNGKAREVLTIGEMSDPKPAQGEVRVRMATSGLNPSDVKKRQGSGGQVIGFPRVIPDSDGAGVVDAVASDVDRKLVGKRVWVWNAQHDRALGTCAEYCCLPAAQVAPLPEGVDFAAGACMGIPAMTAHQALFSDGDVKGKTILVAGGAGAVGHYAIQMAKWGGARVATTVSSDEKAKLAREAGADLVINYKKDDVAKQVLEFAKGGVDRVIEVDFGANLDTNLKILRINGTIASYASMGNPEPKIPFYTMMRRGIAIDLVLVYIMKPEERAKALAEIGAMLGRLKHNIGARFKLDDLVAAHEAQEGGRVVGNIVIDIG
ncbi:MAG: NADPH:quinone reductase [Betaproteobacteria bacterium]|jgi:NADPH2:quinone reductase|nr:NADPH:quinone reductase [Betaproteobacteria bacterium]